MSYTELAIAGVVAVVVLDLFIIKTRILKFKLFWVSYSIVVFFQLITNGILTGFGIVKYDGDVIIGSSTPLDSPPPFIGDGRIAFAPVEDLLFGFSLVVLTLVIWIWLGKKGVQRNPKSGPPRKSMERFLGIK